MLVFEATALNAFITAKLDELSNPLKKQAIRSLKTYIESKVNTAAQRLSRRFLMLEARRINTYVVGSSRNKMVGSATSSIPIFTRLRWPPEMPRVSWKNS